ncbi:hypothetical protein ANO14919_010510 [Xylariales sp. No.14919]|nr:hypothetical protein ANO14919_010510 [Xylariales sp. No.14919]
MQHASGIAVSSTEPSAASSSAEYSAPYSTLASERASERPILLWSADIRLAPNIGTAVLHSYARRIQASGSWLSTNASPGSSLPAPRILRQKGVAIQIYDF